MDQYAVMGNPVSHSKSPLVHADFASQTGQALEYSAIQVNAGEFEPAVQKFFRDQGKGLNITVPFKQEAWQLAKIHSDEAQLAGAVNTLFMDRDGILNGHNTDGIGLVRDILQNLYGKMSDRSILLLGAGGASRGILLPLLRENPGRITIANRTVAKAKELATVFSDYGFLEGCGLDELSGQQFDLVINATSASLLGDLPPLPDDLLRPQAWCYDLMYAEKETVFCAWGKKAGAEKVVNGLGMLVEQAAESFYIWRGVRPDTAEIIARLR